MKKILAYTLAILTISLVSCQREPVFQQQEGKVTVKLNFDLPEASTMTRSLGETVDLVNNGLWVLVYENGYKIEVVQAENVSETSAGSGEYTCKLTLSVTENERNLHFISMEGFTAEDAPYEETRLGSLTTEDNLDAYWQIRTVSCIPYSDSEAWSNFRAELDGPTGSITLIRNFAKVTMSVKSGVTFTLESFKVFKTPDKGYVTTYIPSGDNNGFVSGYDALEFFGDNTVTPAVKGAADVYPGRMPSDCTLSGYDPSDEECTNWYNYQENNNVSQYFYERPVPTENPAFIIVKGKYGTDEKSSYYKVNLRDADDNYYALLRGFRYLVCIDYVSSTGYSSVLEAYNSAGSGNISTSLEYSNVTNISDNNCRIFVNSTSFTCVKAGTIIIKYKFCPDAEDINTVMNGVFIDVDDNDTTEGVEITVNSPASGIQPSIADYTVASSDDEDGWRTITVQTTEPSNLYKEQTITIRGRGTNEGRGTNGEDLTTIVQREIHIIVRPSLSLYVEMAQPSGQTYSDVIPAGAGKDAWINIWMQDELPESIFPLNLNIEATSLTLTPALGEQLPVANGQSVSTTDMKPAFYFVKTITYEEYLGATTSDVNIGGDTKQMRQFVCKFKTNTEESATSIYVSNELFNTASTSFSNPTTLYLTPVSPANWSATAEGEPYAGQTFNATIKASVPAGTTITGTTTVDRR